MYNNHNARRREPVPVGANRPVALELDSQVRSELDLSITGGVPVGGARRREPDLSITG